MYRLLIPFTLLLIAIGAFAEPNLGGSAAGGVTTQVSTAAQLKTCVEDVITPDAAICALTDNLTSEVGTDLLNLDIPLDFGYVVIDCHGHSFILDTPGVDQNIIELDLTAYDNNSAQSLTFRDCNFALSGAASTGTMAIAFSGPPENHFNLVVENSQSEDDFGTGSFFVGTRGTDTGNIRITGVLFNKSTGTFDTLLAPSGAAHTILSDVWFVSSGGPCFDSPTTGAGAVTMVGGHFRDCTTFAEGANVPYSAQGTTFENIGDNGVMFDSDACGDCSFDIKGRVSQTSGAITTNVLKFGDAGVATPANQSIVLDFIKCSTNVFTLLDSDVTSGAATDAGPRNINVSVTFPDITIVCPETTVFATADAITYIETENVSASLSDGRTTQCWKDGHSCAIDIIPESASVTLSIEEHCGGPMITNTGASGATQYDLPPIATGCVIHYCSTVAQVVSFAPGSGDTIVYPGESLGADDELDSPGAIGDCIALVGEDDSTWIVPGAVGTWVDGGAS